MPAGLTRSEAKRDVHETTTCCAYRVTPLKGCILAFSRFSHKMDVSDKRKSLCIRTTRVMTCAVGKQ